MNRPARSSPFAPTAPLVVFCCLLFFSCLAGCGGKQEENVPQVTESSDISAARAAEALLAQDTAGPIAPPNIPEELRAAAQAAGAAAAEERENADEKQRKPIEYSVIGESPGAPEVSAAFTSMTVLNRMKDTPEYSVTGLRQRLRASMEEGRNVLNSFGYYAGSVHGKLERVRPENGRTPRGSDAAPAERGQRGRQGDRAFIVHVTFDPGPQYTLGRTAIVPVDPVNHEPLLYQDDDAPAAPSPSADAGADRPRIAEGTGGADTAGGANTPDETDASGDASEEARRQRRRDRVPPVPKTLEDVGLAGGSPAVAAEVLAAVERVKESFRNRGYPDATIASTRYTLDHSEHRLEADVRVAAGKFARMGALRIEGAEEVNRTYIEALRPWRPGRVWNQDLVESFREALRAGGLFSDIALEPAEGVDERGRKDLVTKLASAPARTVGGTLKYDSEFGPGLEALWEHRNLTGNGDSLRFEAPLWMDMQEATAKYRLPFFLDKRQDFLAQAGLLNEDLDAYEMQSLTAAAGIERRLSRHWRMSAMGSVEGGSLKDPDEPRREYLMTGLPLGLTYSSADSLLDATRGTRVLLAAAPYTGTYDGAFNAVRARVDLHHFLPLISEDNTLILALRASLGSLFGADADKVPPTLRFYSGGGGSVRGYEYQSLGPRNADRDPLGGDSLLEVSFEPRWKITELFGLVAFVDGGMVYDRAGADYGKNMRWGAGIGGRFYTAVGPLRFDVATPLNPRDSDKGVQFYISIGQSF